MMVELRRLTERDFDKNDKLQSDDGCVLVLTHTNLLDEEAARPDDSRWHEAHEFLERALKVAKDFPEVQVALLNSREHRALGKRVGVMIAGPAPDCTAQV